MSGEDNFEYALENTQIILRPQRRLETFGVSVLNYYLVTEEMDTINYSRVREGQIHAEKPQLISPTNFARLMLEGFGEKAQEYADWMGTNAKHLAFLKYGFRVKKAEILCYDVHDPIETVIARVKSQVEQKNDPLSTILTGVDDAWEVCLLKLMMEMVQTSAGGNVNDFKQRGLL